MPRIPILTAQQGPGVLNLRQVQRQTGFEEVSQFGEQLNEIGMRLQEQQDKLDLQDISSQFSYDLSVAKLNLRQNPDYAGHEAQLLKDAAEIQNRALAQPTSNAVKRAFYGYARQKVREELIHVKVDALQLQSADQLDRLKTASTEIASRIAVAPDEQTRQNEMKTFGDLVHGSQANGSLKAGEAGGLWRGFLKDADHATALRELQLNPNALQAKIGLLTTDPTSGVVSYEHFPHLTEEQRFTLSNNARVMSEHAEVKRKQVANDAKDEQLSSILLGTVNKTISSSQLPELLTGMDPGRISHAFNFQNAQQSHQRETIRFDEQKVVDSFVVNLPLATEAQAKKVERQAEISYAKGEMDDTSLFHIKERVQQQLTHVRREARDAEGDQERVLRREYAAATKEIQGWLGVDVHGPGAQFMRDDYQSAVKDLESTGANAVMLGQSPRQAMRQAVPDTMVKLFGGLDTAEKEMWARMAPVKSEAEYADAIRSGRINDPVQRVRMARAYEVLKYIQRWRQQSQPPTGK